MITRLLNQVPKSTFVVLLAILPVLQGCSEKSGTHSTKGTPIPRDAKTLSGRAVLFYDPTPIPEEDVVTQHDDNLRSGRAQTKDLTLANVNRFTFGYVFNYPVDGEVYAQPLYVSGLDMSRNQNNRGAPFRNVVFVATMKNNVYAFDADNSDDDAPVPWLWRINLGPAVPPHADGTKCGDITPSGAIGIMGTPVIDRNLQVMYLVAKVVLPGGTLAFQIHKIDLVTGQDLLVNTLAGTIADPTDPSHSVTFSAWRQLQRPGLLLASGKVIVALGGHCDAPPYQGWVFSFDANTLSVEKIHNDEINLNHNLGGIWQAGQGPASDPDSTSAYYLSGNGDSEDKNLGLDLPSSFVRLNLADPSTVTQDWRAADWFTPKNRDYLNSQDADLGSSGVTLIPGKFSPKLYALGGGKEGAVYLTDAFNLGKFDSTTEHIIQKLQVVKPGELGYTGTCRPYSPLPVGIDFTCHIHGGPVWWRPGGGNVVDFFVWGESDVLRGFHLQDGNPSPISGPFAKANVNEAICRNCMPGGILTISSNHEASGTGIVWAAKPLRDGNAGNVPGQLKAFDATTLKTLWTSDEFTLGKFTPPTVAHDKVYVATHQNAVMVYGIFNSGNQCGKFECGFSGHHNCGDCGQGWGCGLEHKCVKIPCYHKCGDLPDGTHCGRCDNPYVCGGDNQCVCPNASVSKILDPKTSLPICSSN